MTSRHSAFTIGTSPGAKYADRFTGCRADVVHVARDHSKPALSRLERSFSDLLLEVRPERGLRLRIFIDGKRQALRPAIQEQLFLIGREAVVNALRHSKATKIEVEVQYLRCSVRMFVRDNGRGINPDVVQKESDSYWGLREMRDRADTIGAEFGIWSRPGAGTEVRIAVSF
jgi:signal transduction histidine kinase